MIVLRGGLARAARMSRARVPARAFAGGHGAKSPIAIPRDARDEVSSFTANITFIDHEGSRVTVPARVGQKLSAVAQMYDIDIGPTCEGDVISKKHSEVWTEDLFGNGPMFGYDHVLIPREWRDKMPPASSAEMELIGDHWDAEDISDSSRLASQIAITADLNGMTVFVPDRIPADIP